MATFNTLFEQLDRLGILDSLIPFILIFTIVFAVLQKTKILGAEEAHKFNIIISFALSAITVIPHIMGRYPPNSDPITIINSALPSVSVVLVAIIAVLLLVGVFGKNLDIGLSDLAGVVAILAFGIVVYIFGSAAGWFAGFPPSLGFLNDPDTQSLLVMILVFALVIFFITSKPGGDKMGGLQKIFRIFKDAIPGSK
ncbi:hypothetical protein HYY74_04945 [Candidatus Woesearchaeota archaeon]|nr:hypothetical protein [Candidatus Woesearchaeota archaeon]